MTNQQNKDEEKNTPDYVDLDVNKNKDQQNDPRKEDNPQPGIHKSETEPNKLNLDIHEDDEDENSGKDSKYRP